jgi:hypothetical protein
LEVAAFGLVPGSLEDLSWFTHPDLSRVAVFCAEPSGVVIGWKNVGIFHPLLIIPLIITIKISHGFHLFVSLFD